MKLKSPVDGIPIEDEVAEHPRFTTVALHQQFG
jgi:hypothetical protein